MSVDLCRTLGVDRAATARTVQQLAAQGLTVACAESLTGGLLSATLTEIPGSSRVLRGGIVCYATDLKASLVGVDAELLHRVGAVDAAVAEELAAGVRRRCGADIGLGLTGVAGPDWQDGHPPGTVFIALSTPDHVRVEQLIGADLVEPDPGGGQPPSGADGDDVHASETGWRRAQIRAAAVRHALAILAAETAREQSAGAPRS